MPSHYSTRRAQNCPDGFEHQMPNGTWMCGRTHQHNNQTRGFGDDLGIDGFDPEGFGDDLGIDTFDPEGGGMNRLGQQGNQTAGFGDDLGFDGYDPEGGGTNRIGQQDNQAFGDGTNFYNNMIMGRLGMDGYGQRKGGSMKKSLKKNQGGMLQGPSHEQGGIPAIVGGTTPVELEGGEYIINAQTVNAVGQEFLDELNSTQTTYHQGGYGAGELPPPSQFKSGGKVVRRNTRRTKPVPTRRKGGRPVQSQRRQGPRKMAHGGMHNNCPAGMMMGQNGGCVPMSSMASGYRKGGRTKQKPRRMQTGGAVPMNNEVRTSFKSFNETSGTTVNRQAVGTRIRTTKGGPTDVGRHQHTAQVTNSGIGFTSKNNGHSHKVVNGQVKMACPPGIGCHSHQL
jgi:hypothetical protein